MEEKHCLHLTNVKFEEENKNLHTRIRSLETAIQTERTSHEDMKQRYHAAADENTRLQTQMIEKEYQLKHIKIEINHMRDRILETKERLVEIEKTKEKLFQETILSYKRHWTKVMLGLPAILLILTAARRNRRNKLWKSLLFPKRLFRQKTCLKPLPNKSSPCKNNLYNQSHAISRLMKNWMR